MSIFYLGSYLVGLSVSQVDERMKRSHMAQLCRGFLVLSKLDMEKAVSFLITFLRETAKGEIEN